MIGKVRYVNPSTVEVENLTLGSAELVDSNMNQWVRFVTTPSAVNEVTVTNAATGVSPSISATGNDTNIDLQLTSKGTGIVNLGASATATATGGAATSNNQRVVVTSESLTTAAGSAYTLTLTNSKISASDIVMVSVANGTNTQGLLHVTRVTPGAGSVAIVINNIHASQALNGTIVISVVVL